MSWKTEQEEGEAQALQPGCHYMVRVELALLLSHSCLQGFARPT